MSQVAVSKTVKIVEITPEIQEALIEAVGGDEPEEDETALDFTKRVMDRVQNLKDDVWDTIPHDAQKWFVQACDLWDEDESKLPLFTLDGSEEDEQEVEEEPVKEEVEEEEQQAVIGSQRRLSSREVREIAEGTSDVPARRKLASNGSGEKHKAKRKTENVAGKERGESKQDLFVSLLKRGIGASIDDLREETGWSEPTVRSVLSGTVKKRLGFTVTSEKRDGKRFYRIVSGGVDTPDMPKEKVSSKSKKKVKTVVPVKEQYSHLQTVCRNVVLHLKRKEIEVPLPFINPIGERLHDPKTNAMIVNAFASVSFLLTHFSELSSHWFQRKTFHHTRDPIYQRLILSILKGYYVPPLMVAALAEDGVVDDLDATTDWTLIDGLQRTTCYIIAVLMAALGDELVEMGCIERKVWIDTFREASENCNITELLARKQQLEVFYKIDLKGVLHFMLLLNAAQRQMSTKIQLELMNIPLVKILEKRGIEMLREQDKAADYKMDKSVFKGSNMIVAVQGYMQRNPQVMSVSEKETFLGEDREYLSPTADMDEVIKVLKIVAGPLHNVVLSKLESTILSEGEVFITALMAAAGKFADLTSFDKLIVALNKLVAELESGKDLVLLDDYLRVYSNIKSGKGRKIRSIICAAFLEYFRGNSKKLEWEENASVYE
jgi:hypothetical protein